jgi:hypothetical protein
VAHEPLPIRSEEPPPDDSVIVIRAGVMSTTSVEESASRCLEEYGVLGISVEAAIGMSVLEACGSRRIRRYRMVRLSTFGRVREYFALLPTFDAPHFTLLLPDLAETTVARLDRCFDAPIPNPARTTRG